VAGEALAQRLQRSFLDFDREIERREGASIAEIFAMRGEPYFRQQEIAITLELRQCGNMIVAPGGGWEYPFFLIVVTLVLVLGGDGAWALRTRAGR
jgi:shikimate kinase